MLSSLSHAPTVPFLCGTPLSLSKPKTSIFVPPMATPLRIAVVGDVHDCWDLDEDTKALESLQPDLVLFTGDFGEEKVELVQSVANLKFTKAVILGNHDAWHTQKFSGKKKDGVQLQLECVVGGRPFSCGGQQIFRKKLLSARYGVEDMTGSAKRIYNAALGAPEDHMVIILAHNGPTGLGSNLDDICGKDWVFGGGDHGDPDLAQAISLIKEANKVCVPLVVFGHMHKELAHGKGLRKMIVAGSDDVIYLNGAIVPRVKRLFYEKSSMSDINNEPHLTTPESNATMRAFTLVEIFNERVDKIAECWVSVVGDKTKLVEEHQLFKRSY